MRLGFRGVALEFALDEEMEQVVSPVSLASWADFRSENTREGLDGERALLVLKSESYEPESALAAAERYQSALDWLAAHEIEAKAVVLDGIMRHVRVMREEWGIDDEELETIQSVSDLQDKIDLSFVHVFPHRKNGTPFLGFELECNWDPNRGCGVLLNGNQFIESGSSESASAVDIVMTHGGTV